MMYGMLRAKRYAGVGVARLKKIIVFILLLTIAFLPIKVGQNDTPITAPNPSLEPVVAIKKPDTPAKQTEPIAPIQFDEINKVLEDPRLIGTTTSISIRNASNGEIVYSHLGETRVHPASVMKLLTGAAALETLGEDYTFKTEL